MFLLVLRTCCIYLNAYTKRQNDLCHFFYLSVRPNTKAEFASLNWEKKDQLKLHAIFLVEGQRIHYTLTINAADQVESPAFTLADTYFMYNDVTMLTELHPSPGDAAAFSGTIKEHGGAEYLEFSVGLSGKLYGKLNVVDPKDKPNVLYVGTGTWVDGAGMCTHALHWLSIC